MKKKTYMHPTINVIEIADNDIIATSFSSLGVNNDPGWNEFEGSGEKPDGWGDMW